MCIPVATCDGDLRHAVVFAQTRVVDEKAEVNSLSTEELRCVSLRVGWRPPAL
jgi:hypothetical protein